MSQRYLGGFVTANPVQPTSSSASGSWTLQQQLQYAGNWPFGGPFNYIEDVFSTYLYTGNGSTQTITNGIDLAGKGGMVWCKGRSAAYQHRINDTIRGAGQTLESSLPDASVNYNTDFTAFTSSGFSLGSPTVSGFNNSGQTFASWTFRKQPKFFDVVTFTNTSNTNQRVPHNLGSVPGMIFIKALDTVEDWPVYHQSLGRSKLLVLDRTDAQISVTNYWGTSDPTTTDFGINSTNLTGTNYVAYIWASNAGGFGLTNSDNVVTCGSYAGSSGYVDVNLGYEPQYVMVKCATAAVGWYVMDVMRGASQTDCLSLSPNTSSSENDFTGPVIVPTATGFTVTNFSGAINAAGYTWVYMAIRRPMKVPTSGTQVYNAITFAGNNSNTRNLSTGAFSDIVFSIKTNGGVTMWTDRLRGGTSLGISSQQSDMDAYWDLPGWYNLAQMDGYSIGGTSYGYSNASGQNFYSGSITRAAGFCDVVCYTGTGATTTVNHNLTVAPELMIVKDRGDHANNWCVYSASVGNTKYMYLNSNAAPGTFNLWGNTTPTSTVFTVSSGVQVNNSGYNYLAYLFATVPGVSKVGTYTGTGGTQTINAGFGASGARFILMKRTDSTGSWYFFNSTSGLTSTNSPYDTIEQNVSQVTGNNGCYADSTGFTLTSTSSATVNINGASYIYLAIA